MDFQSAMETFAEAWVAANSGKIVLGSGSSSSSLVAAQNSPDPRLESPLQQQLVRQYSCIFHPCSYTLRRVISNNQSSKRDDDDYFAAGKTSVLTL